MKDIFTSTFDRILQFWCAGSKLQFRVTSIFLVALIVICATCALIGAVPTIIFGHDNFFLLENGWRTLYGLRPHLDFWSPWGPLTFLIVGLGLKLSGGSSNGMAYGIALFALLIGLWSYRVSRGRLAPVPRALFSLYLAILACSPHPMGSWPMMSSFAMIYNRFGYALLGIVLVEGFQPLDNDRGAEEWVGGISTGAALALALFLKASFFMVGIGLVATSLIASLPTLRRVAGMAIGFIVVVAAGLAYLRFDAMAMWRALQMAAGARAQNLSIGTPIHKLSANLTPFLIAIVLAIAASFLKPRRPSWLGDAYLPLTLLAICLGDLALLSTNSQTSGLPLLGAAAFLMANRVADAQIRSGILTQPFALSYGISVLLLSALLFLPQFASDAAAISIAGARKFKPPQSCATRFSETRVKPLMLCNYAVQDEDKWSNGSNYTNYVNDGVAMLHRYGKPSDKVMTMDMQNPFPYVLGWAPPRGGMAASAFNYTFSAKFRPSSKEYFGDTTVVMIPKHTAGGPQYTDGLYETYGPALEQRFRLAAESDWFLLYKRVE